MTNKRSESTKPVAKSSAPTRNPPVRRVRRAAAGDVAGSRKPEGIEAYAVGEATVAAILQSIINELSLS